MKRSTVTLLVVLVVLAAATIVVLQRPGEQSSSGEAARRLVEFDSSVVDRIEITAPTGRTVLEKTDRTWWLTAPLRYLADSIVVTSMLNQANHIELKNVVSSNPEKQGVFKVDSSGVLVRIAEKGSERATFRVGKPSSTFSETFVRRENSNDVYLAEGFLGSTFSRAAKDLRDKMIFRADPGSITSVTFRYGDTTFTLALRDTIWRVGNDIANNSAVQSLLNSLSNIQADDFVDSSITPTMLTATIDISGTLIRYFTVKDKGTYLVQTSVSPQWFVCQNWRATQVLKRKKDLVPSPA